MNRRDFLKAICSLPVLAVLPLPVLPKEKITLPPLANFMPMPEYKPTGEEFFEQLEETLNGMPFNDELQWSTAGRFIVDNFIWVEKNGYFVLVPNDEYIDKTPKIHTSLKSNLILDYGKYISDDGGFSWQLKRDYKDGVIWPSTGDNSWVLTHSDKNPHCFIR